MTEEVVVEKKEEDWMQKKWRPAMGWMYMIVCMCDMIIFPVLWALLQAALKQPVTQWNPLTLQGAGLFHLAMGAVLGIAAWGRTQEKVAGAASNTTPVPYTPSAMGTTTSGMSTYNTYTPDPAPPMFADPAPITSETPRPRPRPSL
jgi:hypothetical protein